MDAPDTKALLWENVKALMEAAYGGENLSRLAREAKFGPATSTRIKEAKTSVGIDVLEKLAVVFEVNPWQLIAPKLGAGLFAIDHKHQVVPIPTGKQRIGRPVSGGIAGINDPANMGRRGGDQKKAG